jgi:FkbM family methyltransferase
MTQDDRLGSLVSIYQSTFGQTADIIFDCGTRDGEDAAYLMEKLQAKRVYAIDANPKAIAKTLALHPELTVIETALSNYIGTTTFTQIISERADYEGSSSFQIAPGFEGARKEQIEVSVTTMRQLLIDLGLEQETIDLIKVDLEGYSYEFLQGLGDNLKKTKVLHLETETFKRHEGHYNSLAVQDFMISAGFRLVDVSYEWGPTIEDQVWVNRAIE